MSPTVTASVARSILMVAESARAEGHELVTVAIREEAPPEIEQAVASCYWISLGELSKLIKIFREAGVSEAVMAGRVGAQSAVRRVRALEGGCAVASRGVPNRHVASYGEAQRRSRSPVGTGETERDRDCRPAL